MTIGLRRVRLEFFSLSTTRVFNHPCFFCGPQGGEGVFEPSKRNLSTDFFFALIQNSQTVFDHELYGPLRKVIHLFSADPEEGLPAELEETLQPGLFSFKEGST
jgi:hypothetical protein